MPTFANPAGLFALLGIPAIILIHFLQRKAVVLPVSTLFLLEKTQREATTGRNFDRITNSIPLWMQLLAVLLLTWLLVEPRFPLAKSTQRIGIVIDSSASMVVSKAQVIEQLGSELPGLKGFATDVEYTVFESTPGRPRLYAGSSTTDLLATLEKWKPTAGLTDPTQVLRLTRSLVSREGIVLYVTDTPVEKLPFDARALSVGRPIDNVGFTGVAFEDKQGDLLWRATIQNYTEKPLTRTWKMQQADGQITAEKTIQIEGRSLVTLQSIFPAKAERATLILSGDEFPLDDTLHLVRPAPKLLYLESAPALENLSKKLLRAIDQMQLGTAVNKDLSLVSYDPLDPAPIEGNAVIFANDGTQGGKYLSGGIIAEKHPLLDGLNWQSLLVRETISLDIRPSDQTLLIQDKRPLILLRDVPATSTSIATQQLLFNFDPRLSNIENQPALIVTLLRFAEQIRMRKVAPSSQNLETSQPLQIATARTEKPQPFVRETLDFQGKVLASEPVNNNASLITADEPGFYRYRQGETVLLDAATCFADTREADFRECAEANQLAGINAAAVQAHSKSDPFTHYWILLLIALLLASWYFIREREQPTSPVKA